jgi:hypothetical protein
MHASWQRSAVARAVRSAVASSFLTAGLATLLVGGCGRSDSADRTLSQKVAAVQPSTGNVEDRKLVVQELQKAMQVQGASDGAKLNASMRLADAEIAVGDALARESADLEIKAARLGGEIRALTAQIRANNVAVAGYRGMDPKSAQQAIDEQKDAVAKGKENGLWISDGASPIPAQQTLTTEIDRLNKEIADLQQKRATLENEQKEATAQADKLTEEGIKTKGQQALDLGIQAAELRKKSRDAGAQMEALDLQISHDQHDLKIAQSRQAVAAEALKALDAHKGELDATWSQVSDRMKAEAAMSQKLLGEEGAGSRGSTGASATPAAAPSADATAAGGGAAGANGAAPATQSVSAADMEALAKQNTIAPKLEDIARQVAEAADRRREALDSYGAARRHTNEAAQAAAKLDSELAKLVNDQNEFRAAGVGAGARGAHRQPLHLPAGIDRRQGGRGARDRRRGSPLARGPEERDPDGPPVGDAEPAGGDRCQGVWHDARGRRRARGCPDRLQGRRGQAGVDRQRAGDADQAGHQPGRPRHPRDDAVRAVAVPGAYRRHRRRRPGPQDRDRHDQADQGRELAAPGGDGPRAGRGRRHHADRAHDATRRGPDDRADYRADDRTHDGRGRAGHPRDRPDHRAIRGAEPHRAPDGNAGHDDAPARGPDADGTSPGCHPDDATPSGSDHAASSGSDDSAAGSADNTTTGGTHNAATRGTDHAAAGSTREQVAAVTLFT